METRAQPQDQLFFDEYGRPVRRSLRIQQNKDASRCKPLPSTPTWTPAPAAPRQTRPRVNLRNERKMTQSTPSTPEVTREVPPENRPVRFTALLPNLGAFTSVPLLLLSLVLVAYPMSAMIWDRPSDGDEWMRSTAQDKLPNYALLSKGASIHQEHTSQTYWRYGGLIWRYMARFSHRYLTVLHQGSPLIPGKCWPFDGTEGQLHIELSEPMHIDRVTMGHIVKWQSPTDKITTAPKRFSVYGMKTLDGDETLLGQYQYEENGPAFQTFKIVNPNVYQESFKHIRFKIESNYGNPEYTCLYNVRVHGTPATTEGVGHFTLHQRTVFVAEDVRMKRLTPSLQRTDDVSRTFSLDGQLQCSRQLRAYTDAFTVLVPESFNLAE